ncbi:MAG: beta strand repeat-containing protein [Jatrophihabitantaceae bacterium]
MVLALVVLGQLVLLPGSASAAALAVSTTADVATNFGACGNAGQTSPTGGSLREAICVANNLGATASTITVPAGTYNIVNGELQMGKVSGSNITLTGAGAASTIIDAGSLSRVLDLDPSLVGGVSSSISGVTISHGAVTTFGGAGIIAGSGHAVSGDTLTISNSTISNNVVNSATSNKPGGGVQFEGGSLTITNSTISGNTAGSSEASGVEYTAENNAPGEQLTISGTTFSGNSTNASVANVNVGGALATASAGAVPISVSNSRFINNTVVGSGTGIPQGGGIFAQGGTLSVTESTFTGNSVTGGSNPQGGGVSVVGGTAVMHYNRITGNIGATGSGVSLGVASGATLNATDNWWGCNTGPGTAGCDAAAGSPTVSPRLVLTATASPATVVGPNASSTITASLTTDSLGGAIGAANLDAFAGLTVSWSDPLPSGATLGAASSTLSSGTTSTSYNSQNTSGPGHVLATLDNGTATATITVNRPPAITSANTVSFTVGTAGTFTVNTTGYPAPAITKTGTVPAGMSFVDNGNGTATLSGTPSAGSGGTYPLNLTANNGVSPNATQTLTVTVLQPPGFTSASTATFVIGSAGSFAITTSGFPTITSITKTGTLPAGITFTDNGNGTATLAGTPTGTGGTYPVTLTAINGVTPNGTQALTIQVNQAPAVTTNPVDQTVAPGASVSFIAAASGVPTPTVQWQRSTDGGASFTNIAGATSTTYTFTAAAGDNGNQYRAVFTNVVSSATSTAATLTVGVAPSFTSADNTSFVVGQAGSFNITTTGVPSATLSRTGVAFPAWLTLTDNGDGTGSLTGTPPAGSGGSYQFTLKAANGFSPSASQIFTLFVDDSPVITSASSTTFTSGSANTFAVTTTAGFPTTTTLTKTGSLPSGVTFTDNGDGTATLAGNPAAGTGGTYPITITATATGGLAAPATQSFTLTVLAPPVITSADHATFSVGHAGTFTVTTTAGNPAASTLTKTGSLPAGVSFTDNGDGTATLAGTPAAGTGGIYSITITASNGVGTDATQSFTLTVNEPPLITSADHATFTLGTAAAFTVTTSSGQPASVTLSETGTLPPGMSFTDNGDGTATLGGTPSTGGSYSFTITASNGVLPDATQAFTATVNASPSITSADHTTFAVGSAGSFTVTTTPGVPASTTLTKTGTLPAGVSFTDNGDGTATLAGTPAAGTGGSYPITITASNGVLPNSTQAFTLTVTQLPVITSADHTTFTVGSAGSFTVTTTAGFPAFTTVTETGGLPSGVTFVDNGDGSATLSGTPAAGSGGSYPMTVTATNTAGHVDQAFTLTVSATPVITSADHTTFAVGTAGTFTVTTTAGVPASTTLTKTGTLPAGVSFTDNGDGTATLAGTPAAGTGGSYPITITASNGVLPNPTQSFTLTVTELPVITSANHTAFTVNTAGTFSVTTHAGFPVATTLTETGALPSGVTFVDNGDGTATLSGTATASGNYPLTLRAANTAGHVDQAFTLTVGASPTITSANNVTFTVNVTPTPFLVTTSGGFPTPPALTETGALPAGVSFHDNGNGTATLSGKPTVGGVFVITITANNGVAPATNQSFTLTVNGPPVFTSANTATFLTGNNCATYLITTTAAGSPGTTHITLTGTLPSGVTFHDNGDGTATLSGCVNGITSTKTFSLTLTATNSVGHTTQSFTLRVQPPAAVSLPKNLPPSNGTLGGVPATTTLGQLVHLTGGGFAPGAPITIGYYPGPVTLLTNVKASVTGTFTADIRMNVLGNHTFVASGTGSNGSARFLEAASNTVHAVSGSGVDAAGGSLGSGLPLADTGPNSDLRRTAGFALAALLAGLGLLLIGRRREAARRG